EDARDAADGAGHERQRDRAMLGARRYLGREEGVPRDRDEDRQAGVPPDGRPPRRRTELDCLRLPAGRPSHRAGDDRGRQDGGGQARPSADAAPDGLWTQGNDLMEATRMGKVTRESLMTPEAYAKARPEFRRKVLEHKKNRKVALGAHVTLLFE